MPDSDADYAKRSPRFADTMPMVALVVVSGFVGAVVAPYLGHPPVFGVILAMSASFVALIAVGVYPFEGVDQ